MESTREPAVETNLDPGPTPLASLAWLFLKLGFVAFGGPAAHIAMLEHEVVSRRRWLTRQHFLDLVSVTNLIPGPNSTEMVLHVGYERGGTRGLLVAGASFIGPAALLTGLLAWAYVTYGSLPAVAPLLAGIQPTVIAIILGAVWKLGRKAVRGYKLAAIGVTVAVAVLLGTPEVPTLLIGGLVGMLFLRATSKPAPIPSSTAPPGATGTFLLAPPDPGVAPVLAGAAATTGAVSLTQLGLFFLKIGAVLYGSGYVLVAFLEGGLVDDLGWLSQGQLMDAIAMGQLTPGPVLASATFIGYVIAGVPGAVVATLGIFLPSFVFVLMLNPLIPKLRRSVWLAAFLDAVNVAAVGLMAAVVIELAVGTLNHWTAWLIALLAVVGVFLLKMSSIRLVIMGAVLGIGFHYLL